MNRMTRYDPIREMVELLARRGFADFEDQQHSFAMDVSETPDAYEIKATLPGVKPEDIEITLNNNVLTIRGEVKEEQEREDKTYHLRERHYGFFARSIALPNTVNNDAIEAHYEEGVLKLRLPKAEEAKPKRIQIQQEHSERQPEVMNR